MTSICMTTKKKRNRKKRDGVIEYSAPFSFGKLFWGDMQKGAGKTCSFLRFEVCFLRKVEFIPKRCGCVYWVQSYYTHPGRRSVVFE